MNRQNYFSIRVSALFAVMVFVYVLFSPAALKAEDDGFLQSVKDAVKEAASTGGLLNVCPQYQGMEAKGCTEADQSGQGLNCPKTTSATGGSPGSCEADVMSEISGGAGVNFKAKVEASNLNKAKISVTITPQNSVAHTHQQCSQTPNTCADQYIKRKDLVTFMFACWNSSKVSVGMTDPDFGAQVEAGEGVSFSFTSLICGWANHGDPKDCFPPDCPVEPDPDPVTPGDVTEPGEGGETGTTTPGETTTQNPGTENVGNPGTPGTKQPVNGSLFDRFKPAAYVLSIFGI